MSLIFHDNIEIDATPTNNNDAIRKIDLETATGALSTELDEIKSSKANKTQEPWITATLQNGWTGNLKYYLDSIGNVHVVGNLGGGTVTAGTIIATLPVGYRPSAYTNNNSSCNSASGTDMRLQVTGVNTAGDISIDYTASLPYINIDFMFRII